MSLATRSLVEPLAVRVIQVHGQIRRRLALENWWPGGIVFLFFSRSVNSFAVGRLKRFRRVKKLSNGLCLASGYAFAPEKSVPKQNRAPARITKI